MDTEYRQPAFEERPVEAEKVEAWLNALLDENRRLREVRSAAVNAVAAYPFREDPQSDIDWYMRALALALANEADDA